jgi:hypothetical protein
VLRPGEACRLTRADLMLPGVPGWNVTAGVAVIRSPKTARIPGCIQRVVFRDLLVTLLSQWAWLSWPLRRRLVEMDLKMLERRLREIMGAFDLRPAQFTAAGLRAEGTTHAYLCGSTVEQQMWRGRWETLSSLRHCIQEAAASLAIAQLPPQSTFKLSEAAAHLRRVMASPAVAWSNGGMLA